MPLITRRACLAAAMVGAAPVLRAQAAAWQVTSPAVAEPIAQLRPAESTGWIAVGTGGGLWWLRAPAAPLQLARGIDPRTPIDAAHGRVVARRADGRLWIGAAGGEASVSAAAVARDGGFASLPLGVIAVEGEGEIARLVRLEPHSRGRWQVTARSRDAVLPDARPVQVDLEGSGDAGHIAVLGGPDTLRYAHAVLGDGIEATRVLYLERHGLEPLRSLDLVAPHVFEDNQLRPWRDSARVALVCVRSGPQGSQLAAIEADPVRPQALRIAALGDPIGTPMRWMSPSTDGRRLLSVHTPHIGGMLHRYRREAGRLLSTRLADGVSNHAIGAHDLDLSAWLGHRYAIAESSRRILRSFDLERGCELAALELPAALRAISADAERRTIAAVLEDGSLRLLAPRD